MIIKDIINFFGVDIKRYPSIDLRRRKMLLDEYSISRIIDVGANFGQYSLELRKIGFKGNIYSFEPLSEAFSRLQKNSENDSKWDIFNYALGSKEENKEINVAANYFSSSFLDKKQQLEEQVPQTKYVKKEIVAIKTLDSIFDNIYNENENIFLKIDTQGFEKHVLEGASGSIKNIKGIQLEMSLNTMYEGSTAFLEMYTFLQSYGFELYSIENGFYNPKTGQLNEIEGIFFRK